MREIALTRGFIALIDDRDYERVSNLKWNATITTRGQVYATCTQRIGKGRKGKKVNIKMHRFVLGITDRRVEVDHIDGDALNNQKSNLRRCSHQQNMANMRQHRDASSRFKGVSFHKASGLWRATIQKRHLGYFKSDQEAALAYNTAARKTFGRYARLNRVGDVVS